MSKSILVIDDNELQFLKDVTNQYNKSNLNPEYYSVVNKIKNPLQDTTELLEDLGRMKHAIEDIKVGKGYLYCDEYNKLHKALGGQDD